MKILAVDDDHSVRKLLELVLHKHGYSFKLAKDCDEAMVLLDIEQFDLVLTDINMPGKDGNVLVEFVKSSGSRVPVVALTGEREKASGLFDQVLGKPIYTRELISTIRELAIAEG